MQMLSSKALVGAKKDSYVVSQPTSFDRWHQWRREQKVLQVLKGLARQHVGLVIDGKSKEHWVILWALKRDPYIEAALATAIMRGWIEALEHAPWLDFRDKPGPRGEDGWSNRTDRLYRLTESGWGALNRAHLWTLANTLLAALAIIATILVAL